MAINERLVHTASAAAAGGSGTGNQEEGLVLHLDANDVDSYDGDGSVWYDIKDHEYTPATNVDEHFNTVLYNNNNAQPQSITGVGFQPDLVWIKDRNLTEHHILVDSVRGASSGYIFSDSTSAEYNTYIDSFTSFDTDGFSLGTDTTGWTNYTGRGPYVAWCFKAGGAPSGSDKVSIDGTSYSTFTDAGLSEPIGTTGQKLSVNTELGFSVVYATSTSVNHNNAKLTHGLNQEPEMSIYKFTSTTSAWYTYHKGAGKDRYLSLNTTDAQSSAYAGRFYSDNNRQNALLDSSQRDYVIYNFISKRGVSKVGSFVGTGAAGNKIYTGFEPAFIITKRSSSSGANWTIIDNKRSTDSDKNDYLAADTINGEATSGSGITFNRDGFTFNGGSFNTNGATHIYYAVAKNTKETSLIPGTDLEQHLDPANTSSYSGSGTTWNDLEGTHANATVVASTYDEELGNSFDITSNTISLSSDAGSLDGTSFSFETWLWQDSSSGTQYFFSDTGISFFTISATQMRFIKVLSGTNNDTGYFNPTSNGSGWATNKWNHVVVTFSSTTAKTYINGVLVNTNTEGSGSGTAIANYQISPSSSKWKGKIGQYRVYSRALTQDEIRQNFNFTKNSYPNGFNAVGTGMTSADWNSYGYFDFNGSNEYFTIPNTLRPSVSTITMWIRPLRLNHSSWQFFYNYVQSSTYRIRIGITNQSNTIRFSTEVNNVEQAALSAPVNTSNWYHLTMIMDGNNVRSFVDKTELSTMSNGHQLTDMTATHILGGQGSSYPWQGYMSKVKIYDRALTTTEINALVDEGY